MKYLMLFLYIISLCKIMRYSLILLNSLIKMRKYFFITMQVFHVKDAITHEKDIKMIGWCTGIEYFQGTFVVGLGPSVQMLSDKGDVLHALITNSSREYLFRSPDYIHAFNTLHSSRILVSDSSMKTVCMCNSKLQLMQVFTFPPPGKLHGLAAVGEGQVLVADPATATLQLLNINTGQSWAVLEWEELQIWPNSLVYNPETKCLFVGGNGDEVRMYTLSK